MLSFARRCSYLQDCRGHAILLDDQHQLVMIRRGRAFDGEGEAVIASTSILPAAMGYFRGDITF